MATFKKAKFKKSDDQTNIDKYKEAANITEYQINLPFSKIYDKAIILCTSCMKKSQKSTGQKKSQMDVRTFWSQL